MKGPPSHVWRFTLPPQQPGYLPFIPLSPQSRFLSAWALTADFRKTTRGTAGLRATSPDRLR